jgi:CRP-like cAMP-binding protein
MIGNLNYKDLKCLDENKSLHHFKINNIVYNEGSVANAAYCISKGQLKLYGISITGKHQIVKICSDGDIIGFNELINDTTYYLTAETLGDVYACKINKYNFLGLIDSNKNLKEHLIKKLANENQNLVRDIVLISNQTVFQRLAYILIVLNDIFKGEGINITRKDLADYVGASTENIIRELSYLKKNEIIITNDPAKKS